MSDQTVTELVIDADTSGADQFSSAMDRAGASAGNAQASVAQMTLAIAGVGVAVIAAVAGLRSFVDYVGNQTQALVDMEEHARLAGISTKEFQETLFAARSAGVSEKDFVSGFDKLSADITAASQKTTEFGELFKQNGLSIRQANGDLKTSGQIIGDLAKLMEDASPQVQQGIARIAGLSTSWIPFLRQGGDAIAEVKRSAADLGVLIGDDVIAQAREFNTQWKQAVAIWDLQFKASINSILPLLIQLANVASNVINSIGAVSGFLSRTLTPDEQKTPQQLNEQIEAAAAVLDKMEKFGDQSFRATTAKGALGLPEDADRSAVDAYIQKLSDLYDARQKLKRVSITGGDTILPNMDTSKSELDRATESIERHIVKLQADAEAAGQGAAAQERLRAEALLYDAAQRAGITNLEKYADQFYNLAERAGDAAQALARARVQADIKFGAQTAFLSQDDLSIASKLKDAYSNVSEALNSAEAAQLRFNSAARSLSSSIENSLTSGLTDIATGAKSAGDAFRNMGQSIIKAIDEAIIKLLIVQPLMRSFSSFGGGIASILPSAHGNVFAAGNVVPFARGGVVDSPTLAPMALFGEAGPEAIVPLRRDSNGNLGISSPGGGGTTVVYQIDASGADSGTVLAIKRVLADHQRQLNAQAKATRSAQRFQATGVSG